MRTPKTILITAALAALLFPLAGQAQGRDAYTDLRIAVRSGNEDIGSIEPGDTIDVSGGSRVRLIMSAYAPGRPNDRPIYPVTRYSEETPGRGITIVEANPENANVTLDIAPLGNQQRNRTDVIRYQISDPENRIPDRLERGTVRINVVPGSTTGQVGQGSDPVARRADELTRVLYNAILLRDPDTGARGTVEAIQSNGYDALVDQAVRIAGSDESRIHVYEKEGVCNEKRLLSLYKNLLGIDASQIDRQQWDADLRRMNNGQIANVVNDLVRSDRFRSRHSLLASR
ncbi:MAG TPA: hypothetical protein VE685_15490 [Thermoanaerobaculia bacterium]|nr:hypothetical protein [Thermoanaerobaculia bacterium]